MKNRIRMLFMLGGALGVALAGGALAACDQTPQTEEHVHVFSEWTVQAATCEDPGLRSRHCTVEGCEKTEEVVLSPLGHDLDSGVVTTPATCTEPGVRTRTCNRCQKPIEETISPKNHDWDEGVRTVEPTCTTLGEILLTCRRAGCGETKRETLPTLPHHWEERIIQDATCEQPGKKERYCTNDGCSEREEVTIKALGHLWEEGGTAREATCTEPGQRDRTCLRCGTSDKAEIPALGHAYTDFIVDRYPTFESEGQRSKHCTRCNGQFETETIPKLEANTPIDYEFRVVRNNGERLAVSTISIVVLDGDREVARSTRSTLVNGVFTVPLEPKTYKVIAEELPEGYAAPGELTVRAEEPVLDIYLTASVISEAAPQDTKYRVGSVMHDITFTSDMTTTRKDITLSDLLKTKKAVVLNFWYTTCGPCRNEFPFLQEAYMLLKDDLEVIAVNETQTDNMSGVYSFAVSYGLTFPMVFETEFGLQRMFNVTNVPTTVIIDKEGVVCKLNTGSISSRQEFELLFAPYLADDYFKHESKTQPAAPTALCEYEAVLPSKRES